ncbi:hypothetical protein ACHAPU_011489, partial [Fusarium lateritium]
MTEIPILIALYSFANPTRFYEAALCSFRSTLTGMPPTTLGDIAALCILSHITSSYLHNNGNTPNFTTFSDIDVWASNMNDPQHRQAFSSLIQVLYRTSATPSQTYSNPAPYPFQPQADYSLPPDQVPRGVPAVQHVGLPNSVQLHPWVHGHSYTMAPSGASQNLQSPIQHGQNDYIIPEWTPQISGINAPDLQSLQGSAVIANLARFLEECGELLQVLSGRGATARPHAPDNSNSLSQSKHDIKSACIQPIQNGRLFSNSPSARKIAQRILAIADRFIDLGYLQSIDNARIYLIVVNT